MAALLPTSDTPVNDQVTANRRRSRLLMAGFALPVAAVLLLVVLLVGGGLVGVVLALLVAAAVTAAAYLSADTVALRLTRAREAAEDDFPRYHNVVEGLCIASGLTKPRLYVIDDPAPNALATGRNPRGAAVAVTTGLLDTMNRMELEGVLAHELSHVRNHDILPATLAVTMVGVGQLAVGRERESLADVSGVEMTRYPPGLIAALEKLRDDPAVVTATNRLTAHLWIEEPVAQAGASRTHPPIDERIALLREM